MTRAKSEREPEFFDLIIVGGGPAGSTLGTLTRKYSSGKRILILEKAQFPRHHVGESLLIGAVPVLEEMGVKSKIEAANFPKKMGTTYIWGKDRKPWVANFTETDPATLLRDDGAVLGAIKHSWHVRRAEYDDILLKHAAATGVEVRHGVSAEGIIEQDGRIVGVKVRDQAGRSCDIRCEYLADCSGQSGFLSRYRDIRRYDSRLGNVAVHGYFKGAHWKVKYQGHPDKTKLFICSSDVGWFWYIPVDEDVISIGLVTHQMTLKKRGVRDLKKFFLAALKRCPEIAPLLKNASLIKNYAGSGKEFFVVKDWSYLNVASAGPGWLAAGDASVFVDPILSSGVQLAHMAGQRAASTLATCWKEPSKEYHDLLWEDYNAYYRRSAAHFLATVLFWYGNDRNAERWWELTEKLVRASAPFPVKSKQSFVVIAAGVQDYYERLFRAENLFSEKYAGPGDYPLYEKGVWRNDGDGHRLVANLGPRARVTLDRPYEVGHAFFPELGSGLLRPLKRLKFLLHPTEDPLSDILNPVRIVLPPHLKVLQWLDGQSDFEELSRKLAAEQGYSDSLASRMLEKFLSDLIMLGVVTVRDSA
jgi:clorobiocin biosynthesis protein Clo-hal